MIWRLFFFCATTATALAEITIPNDSKQIVLVTSGGWNSSQAKVRLLERQGGRWVQKESPIDGITGRNGMAWGVGIHDTPTGERIKREGDGRAPAGVFRFGIAFAKSKQNFAWKSVVLKPTHEGIDDPKSRYYNQLVDRREIAKPDWASSEKMKASPHYGLGIWVEHNPKRVPGAGSCIYLHEWIGSREGTSGCTVLQPKELRWLLGKLEPSKKPVLIQLPEKVARQSLPTLFGE